MLQNLVIRKATPSDASEIATLYLASRSKYISFAPLVHSDTAIQQWVHDTLIPDTQVWVVTQDNKIIGMMAILEKQDMNWIEQLYMALLHNSWIQFYFLFCFFFGIGNSVAVIFNN